VDVLPVAVELNPSSLNASSQGNWITATIVTDGWPASEIVVATLRLDGVAAENPTFDINASGNTLKVKFPRQPFSSREDGHYLLPLTGERSDGTLIAGEATLDVHGSTTASKRRRAQPHALRVIGTAARNASIAFTLDQPTEVMMDVVDLQGRTVARIERGTLPAGSYQRQWPAGGQVVKSGMYLVRLRTPGTQGMVPLPIVR
jgi:hypothetical protein